MRKIPVPRTDLPGSPRDILNNGSIPRKVLPVPPDADRVEMPDFFTNKQPNGTIRFIEDFEERVQTNWYSLYFVKTPYCAPRKNRDQWDQRKNEEQMATDTFMEDARQHAIYMGVPEKYAKKVVEHAWSEGHSYGLNQVFNCLSDLIEIFKD